jgi:hypothetical protein
MTVGIATSVSAIGTRPGYRARHRSAQADRSSDTTWTAPLRLYFSSFAPDAPLLGVQFGSEQSWSELDRKHVSRVAANLALYEAYARAEIQLEHGDASKALEMLNNLGTTRRGKPTRFIRSIAREYETRRLSGESAPITAIALDHGVAKSTASRWVAQAKRFGWIQEEA